MYIRRRMYVCIHMYVCLRLYIVSQSCVIQRPRLYKDGLIKETFLYDVVDLINAIIVINKALYG